MQASDSNLDISSLLGYFWPVCQFYITWRAVQNLITNQVSLCRGGRDGQDPVPGGDAGAEEQADEPGAPARGRGGEQDHVKDRLQPPGRRGLGFGGQS